MTEIQVEVVRVRGICNAALAEGDSFTAKGLRIKPNQHDKMCIIAHASIVANIGRLRIEGSPLYVSCPDPGTGNGGNVIFKLSLANSHETDKRETR